MDLTRYADTYWSGKDDRVDQERLSLLVRLIPSGADVLIVDGGPGMLAQRVAQAGHPVRMTDLSSHAVERARKKGLDAMRVDTDDDPLPFPDGSISCVISDSAIEHRYFPEKAVNEAARVLRPGGTFILLVPNIAHWRHRLWLAMGRFPAIDGGPSDRCHLRCFSVNEVRRMVRDAGLVPERTQGFASLWVKGLYPSWMRTFGIRHAYAFATRLRPSLFGRDVIVVARRPR